MAITYRIQVDKENANVTAQFDVKVADMASTELIADFRLNVEGQNLVSDFKPGQKEFSGRRDYILKQPNQDAPVNFSLANNQGWTKGDSDTLRGSDPRDRSLFVG